MKDIKTIPKNKTNLTGVVMSIFKKRNNQVLICDNSGTRDCRTCLYFDGCRIHNIKPISHIIKSATE